MKKILPLILAAAFLISCSHSSQFKTDQEYWADTDFDFDHVESVFEDTCDEDEAHYFACVEALNRLLSYSKESWFAFVFKGTSEKGIVAKAPFVKHDLPVEVKWVKRSDETKPLVRKNLSPYSKSLNQAYKISWTTLYKEKKQLPFIDLMNDALAMMKKEGTINQDNENYYASEVYDAYLEALIGPYTYLVTKESQSDFSQRPDKKLQGIGVELAQATNGFMVQKVMKGGPAEQAGILAGDIITDVKNNHEHAFISLAKAPKVEALSLIRGEEGSIVILNLKRKDKLIIKEVERSQFIYSPIQYSVISHGTEKFLYLSILSFYRAEFCPRIEKILEESKPYKGIILSLRENGGGSVEAAYCLAGLFLEEDKVIETALKLETDLRDPLDVDHEEVHEADDEVDTKTPMVVLVDRNSASASELVAAAFQDHGRAIIVGERTLGKGTGLTQVDRHDEVPYLKRNKDVVLYFANDFGVRPSGTKIEADGVTPDIYLKRTPEDKDINLVTKRQHMLEEFPWSYVYEFNKFPKWKPSPEAKARAAKLEACLQPKMPQILELYQSQLKAESLELPDFEVLQAVELLNCL
ncbi:MAG: S41 family peptidase [Bacteriovoracaceae bacterium]